MGLFDFLKKLSGQSSKPIETIGVFNEEPPIPESERKYYQQDEYYTNFVPIASVGIDGSYTKIPVVTFEERKKTSNPSRNGLYVAEILLLEYCSYGTYPHPKNGYPGFWWFEYGIRNVGAKLKSLEERGFIRMALPSETVHSLTISELKNILKFYNLPVSGKKIDLISRILNNLSDNDLSNFILESKYKLTPFGKTELDENKYVLIMHKHPQKTIDVNLFGPIFNVWEVNRRLPSGKPWETIILDIKREMVEYKSTKESQIEKFLEQEEIRNPTFISEIKCLDKILSAQDEQLKQIQDAEEKYKLNRNIDVLILFWEDIWSSGGLLFNGSKWTFRLPDLYIQQKRYDDALLILDKITNPFYEEKKQSYINRVKEKMANRK